MLKFLLAAYRWMLIAGNDERDDQTRFQWCRDPLSHPAIECMSERELGDLPFRR